MSNAVPIFEAKNKLPLFIHKAESEGPVTLSRRNKEVAVIISKAEYDSLLQKLDSINKKKSFIERVMDFRERNKEFYENGDFDAEIDRIFSKLRPVETRGFKDEENIWDGILEGLDD